MLVLIPVFWLLLAFASGGSEAESMDGTHLGEAPASSADLMTGKPIKIPPKKV